MHCMGPKLSLLASPPCFHQGLCLQHMSLGDPVKTTATGHMEHAQPSVLVQAFKSYTNALFLKGNWAFSEIIKFLK